MDNGKDGFRTLKHINNFPKLYESFWKYLQGCDLRIVKVQKTHEKFEKPC